MRRNMNFINNISQLENYKKTSYEEKEKTTIEYICESCGKKTHMKLLTFLEKGKNDLLCKKCSASKGRSHVTTKRLTTEQFIEKAKKIWGDEYDYSLVDYKNGKTKIKIKCSRCGNIFEQRPNDHLNGHGCRCRNEVSKEEFVRRAKEINGDAYDYSISEYKNYETKIKIKCNKCGNIFEQRPTDHINGKQGCPHCSQSKGEKTIAGILNSKGINYIAQYSFNECRDEHVLPFDFYLPDYNIVIEYQGVQHYRPIRFSKEISKEKAEDNLINQKKRDEIKRKYCLNNGIKEIEIPYNSSIEKTIQNLLTKL